MRRVLLALLLLSCFRLNAQELPLRIQQALSKLENDQQFRHSSISLYIVDGKSGQAIFKKNEQLGLAPASCQKIVTSVSAFEMLGYDYRYLTLLKRNGSIIDGSLKGDIIIEGFGDPTLGSWRWASTKEDRVLDLFSKAITGKGIRKIEGKIIHNQDSWKQAIADGWIWQDIGNYYGAGAFALNWRENQYDIKLRSGNKIGDPVEITRTEPKLEGFNFVSELYSEAMGSGDQAYIYLPIGGKTLYLRGTIPINENDFTISGAVPDPGNQLASRLAAKLDKSILPGSSKKINETGLIYEYKSPSLDSINYWFLKKSVNLYGEAFVKTIAFNKTRTGSTDTGINLIRNFWLRNGIELAALKIIDGSGLSPANRITTDALVKILQYAKTRSWYNSFYYSLPEINGIKMKDGYINGVRSYSGYVKSKDGNEYVFSFIVNNFDGSAATAREKMWKLLDLLK
ncbi:MAG: D-alanyl-D-alanine carboxypeptidase/D-alanyl-D-alanine-endopeptidase [Chitinophagaceae bacterium]